MSDLDRALKIIKASSGVGDGCPLCGWIWWTDTDEPCLSSARERELEG